MNHHCGNSNPSPPLANNTASLLQKLANTERQTITTNLSKSMEKKEKTDTEKSSSAVKTAKTEYVNDREAIPKEGHQKLKSAKKKPKKKSDKTGGHKEGVKNPPGNLVQTKNFVKTNSKFNSNGDVSKVDTQTEIVSSSKLRKKMKKQKKVKSKTNISKIGTDKSISGESKTDRSPKCDANTVLNTKTKKTLTIRQIHKRKKLVEKRKAMRQMKKTLQGKGNHTKSQNTTESDTSQQTNINTKVPNTKEKQGKISLPRNVTEATSNWRKLQMTMKQKCDQNRLKRKIEPEQMRNPKHRKIDEKAFNEKVISEVTQRDKRLPEVWFDDVDDLHIEQTKDVDTDITMEDLVEGDVSTANEDKQLVKPEAYKGITSIVGMDCEMVGVRSGHESILARVSIVNRYGEPIYDKFVKPTEKVTDYRTSVSGVRPEDLKNGQPFPKVRKEVSSILKGRILVGHALKNDFRVLKLRHPDLDTRDTATYAPFRKLCKTKSPGLRKLTEKVMSVKIQRGEHSSIQDAQAAIRLYTLHRTEWESELKSRKVKRKKKKGLKTILNEEPADKLEDVDRIWDVE